MSQFETDEFLKNLENGETLVERAGRHYAEGEARFATVSALAELTKIVIMLAKTQAEQAQSLAELAKSFTAAAKDAETMKQWMEGTVDPSGTRQPGIIDHIGTFKKWKNWVIALLTGILLATLSNTALGFLNHAAVTAPH